MATVRQIHGGWGSFTFLVDDHILRFSRGPAVAAAHHREAALLPVVARSVTFAVPEPDFFGDWDGRTLIGYPLIEGRSLTAEDDWRSLACVLRQLHDVPVDDARTALGCAGTTNEWRDYYLDLWARTVERALPVLPVDLRTVVEREYTVFLDGDWNFTPVLVHRDLAPEHVLVDARGVVVGLIDFEDATVGDPAVDFAGLSAVLGHDRTEQLLAAYGRPVDRTRLRCYWWLAPVHDLLHGLATGDRAIADEAVATLRSRLT
jgi:aminoglycoside phosphotransferase (APT) family kinase protein